MKFWSLMLVCLCCITHIYSQNCGIEEKKTINNIILHKVWSQNTKEGMILISNNPKHADGEVCYYFDSNENLRKIISWSKYPESLGVIIAYYNEEGELMYLIFSDFQPEGYSCQGIAYKTYRGTYNDSIELNYKVQYEATDFENIYVQGNAGKYPIKIGDLWLSQYTHIDSLKFYMKIETLQPPPNCKKVQFYKPSKNQITFTNSHGINFREGANASSKIIRTMVPGEIVKILDVLQEETVKHVGTYNWYKVLVNNKECYIFGAFLEPVEKEVRK